MQDGERRWSAGWARQRGFGGAGRRVISTEAITACAALAFAPRLALYWLRVRRGPEDITPRELTRRLRMSAQTLSFQFKGLRLAGRL